MLDAVFDLADVNTKRELLRQLGALTKKVRVRVTLVQNKRTNQQNKWYHSCIVKSFAEIMTDAFGEPVLAEQAHEELKRMFLQYSVVDQKTGEYRTLTKSTTQLGRVAMAEYCELCRNYLAESWGVIVPDPDPNWKNADTEDNS